MPFLAFAGFKTIAFGLLTAIAPAVIDYLAGTDWSNTNLGLSPSAGAVLGSVMVGLRAVTKTPIFKGL